MKYIKFIFLLLAAGFTTQIATAQNISTETRSQIGKMLNDLARKEITVGKIDIDSVSATDHRLTLFANTNCADIPFREENVKYIYHQIHQLLPATYANYKLELRADGKTIEDLIPLALRTKGKNIPTFTNTSKKPLITKISSPFIPSKGLEDRHIAMWQSHGLYYEQFLSRWEWQRARIFQTVEDLYTQSYVLPFVVPMLENAGATVLLPRERDCNPYEVIVDNDEGVNDPSGYTEQGNWTKGSLPGFAYLKKQYIDFENPFTDGSYRQTITATQKEKECTATWTPHIPHTGKYAIYVSYKTIENSTDDALYTIYHNGEKTQFRVNQQMGGGTWIYLGEFGFETGKNSCRVELSNLSAKSGRIVTADGIKIGGGMGNIARRPALDGITKNTKSSANPAPATTLNIPKAEYPYQISGYPRFTEAARYWMQWAGFPDSLYSISKGKNDYTDDYKCRGVWVNYLAGGSKELPTEKGLNIPIDMSFAFHSDAGTTYGDTITGTLGIYQTAAYNGVFANGTSRYASRDLTDLVQTSIVNDIRTLYEPNWTRRGMWDKSYFEARAPQVPAMLLELLSHENFADMRYGLDPRFRFTVSRAIYKGILRFLSSEYKTDYVVEPLPVNQAEIHFINNNEIDLNWQPVEDPLEPTAKADKYVVYTRIGKGDFDNGVVVNKNHFHTTIPAGQVCSYKITAINKGGESFPSEILSAGRSVSDKGTVLVINGFDRVSAPADFVANADTLAGFLDELDHGVPYKEDISYTGKMKEFRRQVPWTDDDAAGFGDSYGNYETMVIAGNTFDYPALHGAAILKAGYSFTSCSVKAVENGTVLMDSYPYVDLILGKQEQTKMGRGGITPLEFKTFSKKMEQMLTTYCQQRKGNLFISGAYVATDLWDNHLIKSNKADRDFATNILKYKWRTGQAAIMGKIKSVASPYSFIGNYTYYNKPNPDSYVVESPDAIEPADSSSVTIFRYSENNLSAGVVYKGDYKTCILGFPFESIRNDVEREQLMKSVLGFFKDN